MTHFQAPFEAGSIQGDVKGWGIDFGWLEVLLGPLWGRLKSLQGCSLHPCAVLRPIRPSETWVDNGRSISLVCSALLVLGNQGGWFEAISDLQRVPLFPPLRLEVFQPKIKPRRQLHSAASLQRGRGKSRGWWPAAPLASQQLQNFLLSWPYWIKKRSHMIVEGKDPWRTAVTRNRGFDVLPTVPRLSVHTMACSSTISFCTVCDAAHRNSSSGIVLNWPYSTLSTSKRLSNESLVLTLLITAGGKQSWAEQGTWGCLGASRDVLAARRPCCWIN